VQFNIEHSEVIRYTQVISTSSVASSIASVSIGHTAKSAYVKALGGDVNRDVKIFGV